MSEALIEESVPKFDEYHRERDNIVTLGAEVLDGEMHNPGVRYRVVGDDLVAERCGGSARSFFENGIVDAEKAARNDPRKTFELSRRRAEKEEFLEIISMAKTDRFNTMVVVSDFPEEVEALGGDFLGYNVSRKQAMLRIISKQADGTLLVETQTLDGSHRGALEQIYRYFGKIPEPGELLGQRICANIDPIGQELLRASLKRAYDGWLEQAKGGKWAAGRPETGQEHTNTYDFAMRQTDLIDAYMNSLKTKDDMIQYLVMLRGRYENRNTKQTVHSEPIYRTGVPLAMEFEMHMRRAVAQNWVISGCGLTIALGGSLEQGLSAAGYGDNDKKLFGPDEDEKGKLTFNCSRGHRNRRPRGDTIPNCTTCGISVRC